MEIPTPLADFPAILELPVQWGDMDANGHVNNAVVFRWFESARIHFVRQLGLDVLLRELGLGTVVASLSCDYRRQVRFPDTVLVAARVAELGRSSIRMEQVLYGRAEQALVAEGHCTVVVYDFGAQRPRRIPEQFEERLRRLGGASPESTPPN